jgi:hypothetical protein
VAPGRRESRAHRDLHAKTRGPGQVFASLHGLDAHLQPLPGRGYALVSDEDTQGNCEDAPKMVWLLDIRTELVVDSLLAQQQRIKPVAVAVIYGLVCGPLLKLPGIPEAGWINLIFIFLGKPASIVRRR